MNLRHTDNSRKSLTTRQSVTLDKTVTVTVVVAWHLVLPPGDIPKASSSKTLPPLPGPAALLLLLQRDSVHGLPPLLLQDTRQACGETASTAQEGCRADGSKQGERPWFQLASECQRTGNSSCSQRYKNSTTSSVLNWVSTKCTIICWGNKLKTETTVLALKHLQHHWKCWMWFKAWVGWMT